MDSSNPRDIRAVKKQAKLDAQARRNMVLAIMDLPQGRKWIWNLLEFAGVGQTPYGTDAQTTAFLCGQFNVGNYILADILEHAPSRYLEMARENGRGIDTDSGESGRDGGSSDGSPDDTGDDGTAED